MRISTTTLIGVMAALLCGIGCSSDNEPQTTTPSTESPETTKITQSAKPQRPIGPETPEETIARLNQLPAYEDRTEPYPHTDTLILTNEMVPADIRERYESLFHVPIPEYVVGLRGIFTIRDSEPRGSYWLFNIPNEHLEDFKRHLIEDMGVPEKALYEGYHTGSHSYWDKRDMDSYDTEFKELLEKKWADADGGSRFLCSMITQADHESRQIAKGSPVLLFENHADPNTYPELAVDLQSGNVRVWVRATDPD